MSHINLRRKHALGLKRAKAAAQKVADDLAESYGMTSEWDGNHLRFSRKGVEGHLEVSRDEVVLDAKLGLLLSAFRSSIEQKITEDFERYFA